MSNRHNMQYASNKRKVVFEMDLTHIGDSFADQHPIITFLGNPDLLKTLTTMLTIMFILFLLLSVFSDMKILIMCGKIVFVMAIISSISSYIINKNPQHIAYQGGAKIVDVEPKNSDGKRDVTIKSEGQLYKIKKDDKAVEKIQKRDDITLKIKDNIYPYKKTKNLAYVDDNNSVKKHISVDDIKNKEKIEIKKS